MIVSKTATTVTEGGSGDQYTVKLSRQPSSDVTVALSTGTQVVVDQAALVFDVTNWATEQTVVITAVDDDVVEGEHQDTITANVTSSDVAFNSLPVAAVNVQIHDNDAPPPPAGLSVLFVAASSAPQGYEVTLVNHLSDQGHTVSVLDDSLATSNSAVGFDLIYISETVYSGAVGSKFTSLSIPIIVAESWLFDDLHMTSNQSNQYGAVTSNGVHVVDLGHSLAQGLSQASLNLYTSVAHVGWGIA